MTLKVTKGKAEVHQMRVRAQTARIPQIYVKTTPYNQTTRLEYEFQIWKPNT